MVDAPSSVAAARLAPDMSTAQIARCPRVLRVATAVKPDAADTDHNDGCVDGERKDLAGGACARDLA